MSFPDEISCHVTKEEALFLIRNHLEQVSYYERKPGKIAVNTALNDSFNNFDDGQANDGHEIVKLSSSDAIIYTLRTFVSNEAACQSQSEKNGQGSSKAPTTSSPKQTCYACNGTKLSRNKKDFDFLNNRTYDHTVNNYLNNDQYSYPAQPFESINHQAFSHEDQKCETCNGTGEVDAFEKKALNVDLENTSSRVCRDGKINDCLYDVFVKCDDPSIPLRTLTKSKGTIILNQTSKNVSFVNHFPDVKINMACNDMILRHESRVKENPNLTITSQSHQLFVVPITTCAYRIPSSSRFAPGSLFGLVSNKPASRDKVINFKIIGENKMVFIPKRNKNCCPIS